MSLQKAVRLKPTRNTDLLPHPTVAMATSCPYSGRPLALATLSLLLGPREPGVKKGELAFSSRSVLHESPEWDSAAQMDAWLLLTASAVFPALCFSFWD